MRKVCSLLIWPAGGELFFAVSNLKFISTRCSRSAAVGGRLVVLMDPIWVHWDQSHALEWPLPRPAWTTEFQLCLHENHLRARCALQMSKKAVVRRGVT